MINLRLFYTYTNTNRDVYAIPYQLLENINVFACQVFTYNKQNDFVKDIGTYFYTSDGECPGTLAKHVTVMTTTNNLQPKVQKAIKDWKKQFKLEKTNG